MTAIARSMQLRRASALCLAACLLAGLSLSSPVSAATIKHASPTYAVIDVGTLGGPHAELDGPAIQITGRGVIMGSADTTIADSDFPNFNPFLSAANPVLQHAFAWQDGELSDLGALPGNNASAVFEINARGVGAGASETGALDPNTGFPAEDAVLFADGRVLDLGTLPGGHESQALAINDRGQVAGFASSAVPDPVSAFGWGTQVRSFIWQRGVMQDIGTLGGPDTVMATLNARGQIAGDSYTDATPNAVTGVPTTHPFLWTNGHMRDLGTLGGSQSTTSWLNDEGEVVGNSNVAGDQTSHPFLWDGRQLRDLGTLGGDYGIAWHVNDAGDVIGWSSPASNNGIHAFLWRHGAMTDLTGATSSQCTFAEGLNNRDQVVGATCGNTDALLWDNGRQYDLNTLIPPSGVHLTEATFITDRGEIASLGVLPNGDQHVFLLRPTHAN